MASFENALASELYWMSGGTTTTLRPSKPPALAGELVCAKIVPLSLVHWLLALPAGSQHCASRGLVLLHRVLCS